MTGADSLGPLLKTLRLSGLLDTRELRLRQATDERLGYTDFLTRLLADEVERRDSQKLEQRLRCAPPSQVPSRWRRSTDASTRRFRGTAVG